MEMSRKQRRALRQADQALRRSDPTLAAKMSMFGRLGGDEALPPWEQLQRTPTRRWRVLLTVLTTGGSIIAGGGLRRSGRRSPAYGPAR